jgi:tryptophanyl-tRNA synthetase
MLDDAKDVLRKFKRAVTDSESEVRFDRESKPGVSNLLEILSAATGEKPDILAEKYTQYGPLKGDTGEAVVAMLEPIRARHAELMNDGFLAR